MPFAIGLAWAAVVALLLIRAILQFRAYEMLPPAEPPAASGASSLTVIVPARNESANIGPCVSALLSQDYPPTALRTVVVDDNSTDDTAAIVRRLARSRSELTLLSAAPLPEGLTGKPHACWQAARSADSEWLCFVDADTVAAPALLASAVSFAEKNSIDLLSLEPDQELGTFWERLILPAGLYLVAFFAPDLRSINDPDSDAAAADGQFLLIRRRAYEAIGGHAAVRAEIAEDTALARLLKQAGFRTYLMGGKDLIRVRMYTGLSSLWEGLSKNAVEVVGSPGATVLTALGGLLLAAISLIAPLWTWIDFAGGTAGPWALGLALAGTLALLGTHLAGTRYFHIPWWYGLAYPLGYVLVAGIALTSVRAHDTGAIRWKGRVYAPGGHEPASEAVPFERAP